MTEVTIQAPVCFPGDAVEFQDHHGNIQYGEVQIVQSRWKNPKDLYHVYSIRVKGWQRDRHVGERNIVEVF